MGDKHLIGALSVLVCIGRSKLTESATTLEMLSRLRHQSTDEGTLIFADGEHTPLVVGTSISLDGLVQQVKSLASNLPNSWREWLAAQAGLTSLVSRQV